MDVINCCIFGFNAVSEIHAFFGLQYVRNGMLLCVNNKNEYINFCLILYGTKDLHSQKQFGLMSIVISLTHVQRATFELKLEIKVHRIHIFALFFVVLFLLKENTKNFRIVWRKPNCFA